MLVNVRAADRSPGTKPFSRRWQQIVLGYSAIGICEPGYKQFAGFEQNRVQTALNRLPAPETYLSPKKQIPASNNAGIWCILHSFTNNGSEFTETGACLSE